MASEQLSLHHRVHYPTPFLNRESGSRYPTILALHGRGSNEEDLIGLASHLPGEFLWISPRGPHKLGANAYEWYRVEIIGKPAPEKLAAALETIDHFIEEILAIYPVDPQRLFLLGFSQGSILSMCYALARPEHVAGVIAQSGYIPKGMNLEIKEANIKDKPFLLTHGEQDNVLPVDWARASRDLLEKLGVYVSYYEFQMGHQVNMESLAVISTWLKKQLGS